MKNAQRKAIQQNPERPAAVSIARNKWVEEVETPALVTLELCGWSGYARDWMKHHVARRYQCRGSLDANVASALRQLQKG